MRDGNYYLEELIERFALDERVQTGSIETKSAENGWQRSENLSSSRDILLEQRIQNDIGESILLELTQLRRLLEDEELHNVGGE